GKEGSKRVNVIVKYDFDPAASYAGGVAGLRATSPAATGRSLTADRAALDAYMAYARDYEGSVTSALTSRIPNAEVIDRFHIAYGGAALRLPSNRVDDLLAVDGVVAVQKNRLAQPTTDTTPEFIGATEAWKSISGSSTSGEGVIVGVLDSGVWPEHPSFKDPGIDKPRGSFACEFGDGSDPALGDSFACNDKLIGAYAFTDGYLEFIPALEGEFCNNETGECSARDADGHGTHTSTTAAGSPVKSAKIFGVEHGPISGIAPGAHVIGYRVCLDLGCFQSDSVVAVEQAILDGVDVINFSISGGADAYSDPVELAFLDAYSAGISVNASAGNSGPGAGTADHAGPWVTTVGASTSDRHFFARLELEADNGDVFTARGASITKGIANAKTLVDAGAIPGYEDELCQTPLPDAVAGTVVACERGVVGRIEKSFNVLQGGGAGMILYNAGGQQDIETDNHWVPTVHLSSPTPADGFVAFLEGHTGVQARWNLAAPTPVRGDVMADFSSRGPLGSSIKPDVTAPGIQVLAGHTPQPVTPLGGPPGELFQAIAGTSMSSPHSAGVSALVKAAHPNWTPGEIKSALMTSATQRVLKEDGVTPADPFDRGAGSIRAHRAINPGLVFAETPLNFFASAGDPLGRVNLNVPSVNAPVMQGRLTVTRTARNRSGNTQTYTVEKQAPEGGSFKVTPARFTLEPGERIDLSIKIFGDGLDDDKQYFGHVTFDPASKGLPKVDLPVAFVKAQGEVALTHSCGPRSIPVGAAAGCQVSVTNFSPSVAGADVAVKSPDPSGLKIRKLPGRVTELGKGFRFSAHGLSGAIAPTIDAIEPGGTGFGYVSLASLGVPDLGPVGDEELINFGTSPYLYGSETYEAIGMTSNGYAIAGGGGSGDVNFVPQTLPDPAAPNNVLAPFWTDLNPGEGGDLYAAEIADGDTGQSWIVLEWEEVPDFTSGADPSTFQIWVETTPGTEAVSYEYGPVVGAGDPIGLTVGAENRDGTSGVMLDRAPVPDEEFSLLTSPPMPGGSETVTYRAKGKKPGRYALTARMRSSVNTGTRTDLARVRVTP
ncbi:MAG: S8 family serine peptidase, partial [Actinobacteria bacterium]|nr:S8 family serine peptidase [Actinomycetota bacterium]